MYIVIDTNIFFNDWTLHKDLAQAFLDYVRKTRTKVMMPRVVMDEVRVNYRQELEERIKSYERSCRELNGMELQRTELTDLSIDIDAKLDEYVEYILERLRIDEGNDIIDYSAGLLEKVTGRAIHKRSPFNSVNQREFKDALIWESVLEVAAFIEENHEQQPDDRGLTFISNDRAFSISKDKPKILHPELKEDLMDFPNVDFNFYNDFESFVAAHHTPIAAITKEAVLNHIEASDFLSKFFDDVIVNLDEAVELIKGYNPSLEFPHLHDELYNKIVSRQDASIARQLLMFVYLYKEPEKTIVFQRLEVLQLAEVSYYEPYVSTEISKITLKLSFRVQVTIPYENQAFGEVSIDNADLNPGPGIYILRPPSEQRIAKSIRVFPRRK
ncbi:DUF4935 domain-containing protein [Microvirga sp. STR05]|uniref:DUF4935 domain-containing protein n=1 Tax=Hymenobacter duratus TaxID=2771356 RepID=A0ABR8JIQ1_9BACT|nr:PIN domain-containing protein [Hymenobacter duratus]MBD2716715.1 DUF4935 domain-containing protein [Hymenobacter duratus]MBR7951630.1 DUF4935 domain-containing protein [Microvirga sp. STR05]